MAQKVKVLASKGEDLGSIPGTHRELTSRAFTCALPRKSILKPKTYNQKDNIIKSITCMCIQNYDENHYFVKMNMTLIKRM